jgi:hypothetical protein
MVLLSDLEHVQGALGVAYDCFNWMFLVFFWGRMACQMKDEIAFVNLR